MISSWQRFFQNLLISKLWGRSWGWKALLILLNGLNRGHQLAKSFRRTGQDCGQLDSPIWLIAMFNSYQSHTRLESEVDYLKIICLSSKRIAVTYIVVKQNIIYNKIDKMCTNKIDKKHYWSVVHIPTPSLSHNHLLDSSNDLIFEYTQS